MRTDGYGLIGALSYSQEGRGGAVHPSWPIAKSATDVCMNVCVYECMYECTYDCICI